MKKYLILLALIIFPLSLLATTPNIAIQEIQNDFNKSVENWNQGNLYGFVSFYKDSAKTEYVTKKSVVHGYKNILLHYQDVYPTNEAMGKLAFSNLDIKLLSPQLATVKGKFVLSNNINKHAEGVFTTLVEKTPDGWKIVKDHVGDSHLDA